MGTALTLNNISKFYENTAAADKINLDIREGEFLTLLGPSGSGKTTLLMMIAGFTRADQGQILMDGIDITRLPAHCRNIGMVFQNYALFPHMTVFDNISYPLKLRNVPGAKRSALVREAIEMVRLQGLEDRMPAEISGGQKQRVALARALVFKPPILLMDEPLSALDKKLREHMQLELKAIQEQTSVTVLYVTHDQEEALTLSSRIAVMDRGIIQQTGTPSQVYHAPANRFVADFIGETNFLPARVDDIQNDTARVCLPGDVRCDLPQNMDLAAGTEGVVSIRPENLFFKSGKDDGQGPALPGQIQETLFLGDAYKFFIRLTDADLTGKHPVVVIKRFGQVPEWNRNDRVSIGWNPADANFFT